MFMCSSVETAVIHRQLIRDYKFLLDTDGMFVTSRLNLQLKTREN